MNGSGMLERVTMLEGHMCAVTLVLTPSPFGSIPKGSSKGAKIHHQEGQWISSVLNNTGIGDLIRISVQ